MRSLPLASELGRPCGRAGGSKARLVTVCVAMPSVGARPPTTVPAKRSKVELLKERSDFLRHPLMQELVNENSNINEEAGQLMKFHGSYQQDDRDKRGFGKGKYYMFMMRTKQAAGIVPNQLYLAMDELADKYGNGTLRLTTRQTYQLHGVLKGDLKTVFSTVIKNLGSTLGACGDVNRNIMAPPAPFKNRADYAAADKFAADCAELLAPQSGAYYDVWLDGEKFVSSVIEDPKVTADRAFNGHGTNFEGSPEPIYGSVFLPRKFKIGVTVPGDNSLDLLTNDVGVVVMMAPDGQTVEGYNIYVGGGMGRTARNNNTFPLLAQPLGYVPAADIWHAMKAIVATQRDYGRRDDRKQARLKYLVHEWGIDRFRTVAEQYLGKKFEAFRELPPWEFKDFLGWTEQGDGKLAYGIFVQNGRLKGEQKVALRQVIERYGLPIRLTPNQNLILTDIEPAWREELLATLQGAGIRDVEAVDSIERESMACPALPTCGLAVTESERAIPSLNERLRETLGRVGLPTQPLVFRMTGCPNGCARPYMAELGLVGDGPNSYQVWLGGAPNLTRLATVFQDRMKMQDTETTLEPLFAMFAAQREGEESFGDFTTRVGFEALRSYAKEYTPASRPDAQEKELAAAA